MKTYEEMTESVLEKSDKIIRQRTKRRQTLAFSAVCAVLAVCAVFAAGRKPDAVPKETGAGNTAESYAVYTPEVKLPGAKELESADMTVCVVYHGKVYTYSGNFADMSKRGCTALLGEKLGETKAILDEWSGKDKWEIELASATPGTLYTVKGYDPEFRLCLVSGSGNPVILDNFDGIGLNTGADLFEKRYHLKENYKKVTYLNHSDWDFERHENEKKPNVTDEQLGAFFDALYKNEFVQIEYKPGKPSIYDNPNQAHLFFEMKDGSAVEIRLIEGGYVGYRHLGWIFVKMPGEAFDRVFEACK